MGDARKTPAIDVRADPSLDPDDHINKITGGQHLEYEVRERERECVCVCVCVA